ncbi:endonuclease/exonuclease/phosphatase family protein [Flagellimonas aequoris]|uniref:Endonuclease n=1 Tax=Flagellimonas aequoris TaxID=2306997 RepID=A0A418N5T1_9FLAO|nr:endonuclease/exonuclease/phosphatase family protein [Allomuricauda aequoris]RIV69790.1 endonuclease [Allomuricauda aequoris]TXK01372.1 endonuclease [Allomuricauda aequoris]
MNKSTSIFDRVVFAVNLLIAILLLFVGVLSFVPFQIIPILSVLSLFVPFLFILNILFVAYWLIKRKRKFLLSFFALVLGYLIFGRFYGVGNEADVSHPRPSDLKVMTFNAWGFNKNGWIKESDVGDKIIAFIKDEDPDILCFQEYDRNRYRQLQQYPYRSETPYGAHRTTQAIFSKYPIIGKGSLDLPGTINNIIYVDIAFGKDTLRIYNTHLQSFSIIPSTESFADGEKSERTFKRLTSTFKKQLEQAKIFRDHIENSPYTNIVCGDFNNTQFSNIYKIIKGDRLDTFLEKGNGFGRTYDLFKFPIRIDYILADPEFEVLSHQNFNERLSDHFPVMATLRLDSHQ